MPRFSSPIPIARAKPTMPAFERARPPPIFRARRAVSNASDAAFDIKATSLIARSFQFFRPPPLKAHECAKRRRDISRVTQKKAISAYTALLPRCCIDAAPRAAAYAAQARWRSAAARHNVLIAALRSVEMNQHAAAPSVLKARCQRAAKRADATPFSD